MGIFQTLYVKVVGHLGETKHPVYGQSARVIAQSKQVIMIVK